MNNSILIPLAKQFEGQSKLILKGAGLGLLKPKFFNVDYKKIAIEQGTYEQSDRYGYSKKGGLFGLPIWDVVTLISPSYTDNDGNNVTGNRLTLDIALLEISNERNIVKTPISGRNGTVKEYMSDGDYDIVIKGSLASNYANLPPIELLEGLQAIVSCPETLTIESNLLEYFRVFNLVIDKPIIRQREGTRNVVDYELICSSDSPFDLE